MLKGNKVRVRSLEREDLPRVWQWFNDEDVMYYWASPGSMVSMAELERHFSKSLEATDYGRWFIIEDEGQRPIGLMMYFNLDRRHRRAEVGILIGEKDCWDKGYGTEAMIIFLDYLFNELGLHRVYLHTQDYNLRAFKSYEKCGFVKEGVVRERYFIKGKYHDGFLMSILSHEFSQRFETRLGGG